MPGGPEYPVLGGVENKKGAGVSQSAPFAQSSPYSNQGGSSPLITPDFIGSVTVVYTPTTSPGETFPGFIASATTLYPPTLGYLGTTVFPGPGTYTWICPPGITLVYAQGYGGGGAGGSVASFIAGGGGGGGAYADRGSIAVTPGSSYTVVVGSGGATASADGNDSSFTGDSQGIVAKGGKGGATSAISPAAGGAGGLASASTGATKHDGGTGGNGVAFDGGGGGASGNISASGNNGSGLTGGAGANGGGSGGHGGDSSGGGTTGGSSPGGGGGGWAGNAGDSIGQGAGGTVGIYLQQILAPFIGSNTVVYAPTFPVQAPFIASVTVVYAPALAINVPFISSVSVVYAPSLPQIDVPFIGSSTVIYAPGLGLNVPFIPSTTRVYRIFNSFDPNLTFGGHGNGGEAFAIRLAPNGSGSTATLAANIGASASLMSLTGDSGLPSSDPFVVTVDTEVMLVSQISAGSYQIRLRGLSNTVAASHTAGATASWTDSYEQAIVAADNIAHDFTADILGSGSFTYPGWLVCFDATQAYLSGSRYPMHVTELVGVFDAGAGSSGTSRLDQSQPNAISSATGTSDDCPAALSNPARIQTNIVAGDVAVVRFTNPEATELDLGPRSVALQSWFGLKRVSTSDADVTFTDPNGIVVDTTGTYDTFTGAINDEFHNPSAIGIGPDTGTPTPNPEPYTTVTLPGADRFFTRGSGSGGYNEKGWPFGVLTVRQGNRRVPFWQSYDWHNFSYVYNGFGTDCTFAQIVVNRNGVVNNEPEVVLPGPQDIDGPNAVWDDGTYYFGVSWYVAIFSGPYLVIGPPIGGVVPTDGGGTPTPPAYVPGVTFPPGPPVIVPPTPPPVEGGGGGDIAPGVAGLHVWQKSGGF